MTTVPTFNKQAKLESDYAGIGEGILGIEKVKLRKLLDGSGRAYAVRGAELAVYYTLDRRVHYAGRVQYSAALFNEDYGLFFWLCKIISGGAGHFF